MRLIAPDDRKAGGILESPVSKGDVVEVPDEVGASLVEQGWKVAKDAPGTVEQRGASRRSERVSRPRRAGQRPPGDDTGAQAPKED